MYLHLSHTVYRPHRRNCCWHLKDLRMKDYFERLTIGMKFEKMEEPKRDFGWKICRQPDELQLLKEYKILKSDQSTSSSSCFRFPWSLFSCHFKSIYSLKVLSLFSLEKRSFLCSLLTREMKVYNLPEKNNFDLFDAVSSSTKTWTCVSLFPEVVIWAGAELGFGGRGW